MIDRDSTFVRAISKVDAVARHRLVAIAVALAVVASAPVALGETPQRAADAKLARALARLVSMPGGPPGAIAVVQRGNTVKVFSAGVAELGAKRRPSLNDHVRLASMSKAYSGAAALSLVSQGRLSLDDTIAQRLPRLPTAWGNVTLRQLLNHTSGLPDFVSSEAAQQAIAASLTVPPRPDQLLDFVKDEPLKFAPGSKYTYSNSDNVAVGLMVAAVSRTTYEQQLQEQIFGPLGLTRTSLAGRPGPADAVRPRLRRPCIGPTGGSERGDGCRLGVGLGRDGVYSDRGQPVHPRLRRRQALRHSDAERAAGGHSWRRLGAARPGS